MIEHIDIKGVHTVATPNLKKYINRKFGHLDRFVPKADRSAVRVEIALVETKHEAAKQCHARATIHLPHAVINAEEATVNIFAAVDIVEAKLRNQLVRYKETHGTPRLDQRLLRRLKRVSTEV